jgi:hypothetical protein
MTDDPEPAQSLPPPETENPPMEIHKPKPFHNWREFLAEIGTITLGVLIALAAEQAVEWLHWQDKTAYATEQIQYELARDMGYSMERVMVNDCIQRRLDDLEQKLLDSGEKWTPVTPASTIGVQAGNIVAQPTRNWTNIAWTAAVADTSVTHFNRDRLTLYARLYGQMDAMRGQNQFESENVVRLNILSKPVILSNDKKNELIGIIEAIRSANHTMVQLAAQVQDAWKQIGLDPTRAQARMSKISTTYAACQADTPRK